jgi:hypothetical protein
MGVAIFVIVIVVGMIFMGVAQSKKMKADLAVMPAGTKVIGHGFYYTPTGEIWKNRVSVQNVHAEVHATQRHTLTRVVTVVGAATKKTNGSLVITYTGPAGVQVITKHIGDATAYRNAMTFAAKVNAIAGTTSQTA